MEEPGIEWIRSFRLRSHHLDAVHRKSDIGEAIGACGMQNTPSGAQEVAPYNRVPDCTLGEMEQLLYEDKTLLQAWSLRGAPIVFPTAESDVFLFALIPRGEGPRVHTQGITLALDFLEMEMGDLSGVLLQVMPQLDDQVVANKNALDETIAQWMAPLLPSSKRGLRNRPSVYGSPDKQTVGGAVVSFLLRPRAFRGLVVFGERNGTNPVFTSYKNWTGHILKVDEEFEKELVRKYLHCYGPTTINTSIAWLGCSRSQGWRMWESVSGEMKPVGVLGKEAFTLSEDKEQFLAGTVFSRELLFLGAHDPFLDQRDRMILQPDQSLRRQIWKLVTNPGTVIFHGEIIGVWTSKKKGKGMEIKLSLWEDCHEMQKLCNLAEEYVGFRQQELVRLEGQGNRVQLFGEFKIRHI